MRLHTQVEQYILEHIQSGEWALGVQIPTETELAQQMNISRPTVRQALTKLTTQGYLERIKGKGTFVTQPKLLHESTSMISSYRQESQKQGLQIHTKVVGLEVIKAGDFIAEKLNLSSKAKKVMVLTRLRRVENYNDNKPVVYTTVYVPYDLFPRMLEIDFTQVSFYDVMEEEGFVVKRAKRELEAIIPKEKIADQLKISRFEPVIYITSVGELLDGKIIEYSESMYPAGCSKFQISIER